MMVETPVPQCSSTLYSLLDPSLLPCRSEIVFPLVRVQQDRGHVGRGLIDELVVLVEGVPACHQTLEKLRIAAVFVLTFAQVRSEKVHGFLHGVQRHFVTLQLLTSDLEWYEDVDR